MDRRDLLRVALPVEGVFLDDLEAVRLGAFGHDGFVALLGQGVGQVGVLARLLAERADGDVAEVPELDVIAVFRDVLLSLGNRRRDAAAQVGKIDHELVGFERLGLLGRHARRRERRARPCGRRRPPAGRTVTAAGSDAAAGR